MSNSKRVAGKLFGGALLAGAIFGFSASKAEASLKLDLRVEGATDAKKAVVSKVGDSFTVDVYAVVSTTASSSAFANAFYNIASTTQANGIKLSLGDVTLPDVFNQNGAQLGAKYDLDGDGTIDFIGDKTDGADSLKKGDFIFSRAALPVDGAEQLIGKFTFTVTGGVQTGAADAKIDIIGRKKSSVAVSAASWKEGTAVKDVALQSRAEAGSSILVSFGDVAHNMVATVGTTAVGASAGTVNVKANAKGYLSAVADVANASAGSVAINVTGTGPAGPVYAMLWLTGDVSKLGPFDAGTTIVTDTNDSMYKLLMAANGDYAKAAGSAPSALLKIDSTAALGGFFNFDFGTSGIQLDKIAVVPEPASFTVLGLGAAALMMARRRRA